jgi:hypothetical protein
MSTLEKIAFFRNIRNETPNQELARDLAASHDAKGIKEIAFNLGHKNKSVQSDCLKVLYEIGYLKPELISPYVNDFLKLLGSGNNRMVWGAMIALATIGGLAPREIWEKIDSVTEATEKGSLITFVWGVKTLARVAAAKKEYAKRIVPRLMEFLRTCNPRDVPMHLDSMLPVMDKSNKKEFLEISESRKKKMTSSQLARLKRVIKKIESI